MEIHQIRYFSRVYELHNYAAAAEDLYLSRQGLHKSIRHLEGEVGQKLFDYDGASLRPTQAGVRLYQATRTLMRGFYEAEGALSDLQSQARGIVRYALCNGPRDFFTPEEAEKLERASFVVNEPLPVTLHSRTCLPRDGLQGLLSGKYDYCSLVTDRANEEVYDVRWGKRGRVHALVPATSPLAKKSVLSIADLAAVPIALEGEGYVFTDILLDRARRIGFEPEVVHSGGGLTPCLAQALNGLAVTYSFLTAKEMGLPTHAVVSIPFEERFMRWGHAICARKGTADPYLLAYFSGSLTQWEAVDSAGAPAAPAL